MRACHYHGVSALRPGPNNLAVLRNVEPRVDMRFPEQRTQHWGAFCVKHRIVWHMMLELLESIRRQAQGLRNFLEGLGAKRSPHYRFPNDGVVRSARSENTRAADMPLEGRRPRSCVRGNCRRNMSYPCGHQSATALLACLS